VLLDEVENAGIHRKRALELLREHRKIFIFVTHDPRIALLSDYRIVMKGGAVTHVLTTNAEEHELCTRVGQLDDFLSRLREKIRLGERLTAQEAEVLS
jgi:ABC-type proline/glycine betaine transport system ATPase subunit